MAAQQRYKDVARTKSDKRQKPTNPERKIFDCIKEGRMSQEIEDLTLEELCSTVQNNGTFFHKALEYYGKQPSNARLEIINVFVEKLKQCDKLPPSILKGDKNNKNIFHYACLDYTAFQAIYPLLSQNYVETTKLFSATDTQEKRTPMHGVLKNFNFEAIERILKYLGNDLFFSLLSVGDITGTTPFHLAITRQPSETLVKLLNLFEVDAIQLIGSQTKDGRSALHIAGKKQDQAVILKMIELLENNLAASLRLLSKDGWTPLHTIFKYQKPETSKQILMKLNEEEITELVTIVDTMGITPFHLAICFMDHEVIQIMLEALKEKLYDVALIPDPEGHNSFHSAMIYQNWETVLAIESILGNRIKDYLVIIDHEGLTPLHLAIHRQSSDMAERMLELHKKYECNFTTMKTKRHCTILHEAIHFQPPDVLQKFVETFGNQLGSVLLETDAEGYTGLHVAAQYQKSEILVSFLKAIPTKKLRPSLLAPECDGWTVLHYAAKHQHVEFLQFALGELGDQACDAILQEDNFQCTLFHLSCKYRSPKCVEFLMNVLGDKVPTIAAKRRHDGNTPLHLAVRFQSTEVVEKMLKYLGDNAAKAISRVNADKKTVLHVAARNKNTATFRLVFNALGTSAKDIVLLEDKKQMTVLHLVVKKHGRTVLRQILDQFHDSGVYLLNLALLQQTCSRSVVSILLRLFRDNTREEILRIVNGQSALHLAAAYHPQHVIGLILISLDKDKDITSAWLTKNAKGKNCSQLTKKNRQLKGNRNWDIYYALRFEPALMPQMKASLERLTSIEFNCLPLTRSLLESFVGFAHTLRSAKKISFRRCRINDASLQVLLPWLNMQTRLDTLILSDNNISSVPPLFDTLDKLASSLKVIHLQNNWITCSESTFLKLTTSRMRKYSLEQFDISGNFLFIDPNKPLPRLEQKRDDVAQRDYFANSFYFSCEDTITSVLSPLHGTDTNHWHVMLVCKKTRERAKIFLEGMNSNGQRFLRCIRVPHFSKVRNVRAVNRCLPLATLNLSKYRGKSWPISRAQGLTLLETVKQDVVLDVDSTKTILVWGVNLLSSIGVSVSVETFVEASGIRNSKNCSLM